jgi:hypothetical protein
MVEYPGVARQRTCGASSFEADERVESRTGCGPTPDVIVGHAIGLHIPWERAGDGCPRRWVQENSSQASGLRHQYRLDHGSRPTPLEVPVATVTATGT